MKLYLSMKI